MDRGQNIHASFYVHLQKEELMETFPSKLFGARLISKLECMDCSHTVTHEEEFLDISVEVPQTGSSKSHR